MTPISSHVRPAEKPTALLPFRSSPLYEMGDDVGTSYRIGGGGGSSDGAAWQESAVFMPAPPVAAHAIYLRSGQLQAGDQFVVLLPG